MDTLPVNSGVKPPESGTARVGRTRFAQVPAWVASHPMILEHPTALAVYVHLGVLSDYRTRITTSDWREITNATGWSKPTVMRSMKTLREAGAVIRNGGDIWLPMDQPAGIKNETEPDDQSQIRDRSVSDVRSAPLSTENSELPPDGGKLPLEGIPPNPLDAARSKLNQFDDAFEDWWKAYPRKVDKKQAKTAYIAQRRKGSSIEDLRTAASNYAKAQRDTEPRFMKHGSTFLNNGWDEWIAGDPEPAPIPQAQREFVPDQPRF